MLRSGRADYKKGSFGRLVHSKQHKHYVCICLRGCPSKSRNGLVQRAFTGPKNTDYVSEQLMKNALKSFKEWRRAFAAFHAGCSHFKQTPLEPPKLASHTV